jgi:DNA-binding SARP family transcriptional activator
MQGLERPVLRGRLLSDAFEACSHGIVILSKTGHVLSWNPAAADLTGDMLEAEATCCEVFGCRRPGTPLADGCLTEMAIARGRQLDELGLEPPARPGRRLAVIATPFARNVLLELRASAAAGVQVIPPPATIRIRTLGETVVETSAAVMRADWLDHRPGRLLKYLVAHRYTPMHADAIAEALWPRARADTTSTVRHLVHALREKLEPSRGRYQRSIFILARNGGYLLNPERVTVDADDFEREAKAGLIAMTANERPAAVAHMRRALELYSGDFLIDERFEDWAIAERERLRELATKPLRILAQLSEDGDEATAYLERLAAMEPLDVDIHKELIVLWLRQGRRGRALRHYRALQSRLMRELGERVTFDLVELMRSADLPRKAAAAW